MSSRAAGKKHRIALFFTYGMSLAAWKNSGLFSREIRPYLEMARLGHEVTFYTYGDSRELEYRDELSGIKIRPILSEHPMFQVRILALLYSFLFPLLHIRELKSFNIFKSNQMWGAWVPLIAAVLTRGFFLARVGYELFEFSLHNDASIAKRGTIYVLSKAVYRYCSAIFCTSPQTKKFIQDRFNIDSHKIVVHSNYVDTELFAPARNPEFNTRVLFVGRFSKIKRIPLLMDACNQAQVGLDMIGKGELEEELQQYSRRIKLDCKFLGTFPNQDLPAILQQYSLFALTSKSEGNPKALLEAMSCGLCPIGVIAPGITDILDGGNGILAEADVAALSNAMRKVVTDNNVIRPLQLNARKYVEDNCSLQSLVETEMAIFQRLDVTT